MAALDLGDVEAFPFVEPPGAARDRRRLPAAAGARRGRRRARADAARARARAAAGRSARRPHGARGARARLPRRGAGDRERAVGARSARAAARRSSRRPTRRTSSSATSARISCRCSRCGSSSTRSSREKLSHRRLVDACRAQFVSYLRLHEWRDVHAQLAGEVAEQGWKWDAEAAGDDRRRALRSRSTRRCSRACSATSACRTARATAYLGARGIRFHLHPGSGLAKKAPKWVLAAELVETSRLYARCAAKIEPEWIEAVAGDRVTRDYFEPHWDAERGEVVASERVQLYGLTLVPRRRVSFGAHRPEGRARGVHPRGARAGRARDQGRVPRAQPEARRRGRRARAQGAAAGRAGRRRGDRRVLRRARARRASIRSRRSSAGATDAERSDPRAAVPDARGADAPRGGARDRGALSRRRSRWPAPSCRSSTASRRASRWTASRSRCRSRC